MTGLIQRVRISVLWVFLAVTMSASMLLYLMEPGMIAKVMSGELEAMRISEGVLLMFGLFWLIPLIMAYLSVILKGAANRWTNFILGLLFALFYVIHLIGHLAEGNLPLTHLVFGVLMIVAPALIAWHGWRLPKQEA